MGFRKKFGSVLGWVWHTCDQTTPLQNISKTILWKKHPLQIRQDVDQIVAKTQRIVSPSSNPGQIWTQHTKTFLYQPIFWHYLRTSFFIILFIYWVIKFQNKGRQTQYIWSQTKISVSPDPSVNGGTSTSFHLIMSGREIQLFCYITNSWIAENENAWVTWSILGINSDDAIFSNSLPVNYLLSSLCNCFRLVPDWFKPVLHNTYYFIIARKKWYFPIAYQF